MSVPWANWFKQLFLRTGGANAPSNSDITALQTTQIAQAASITSIQSNVSALQSSVVSLQTNVTALQVDVNGLHQGRQL